MRRLMLLLAVTCSLGVAAGAHGQVSQSLSPHERQKAEWLLEHRLACLGCHVLDGSGGRIGPDLSDVGDRRSPAFIRAKLADPPGVTPGTVMPRPPLSQPTLELLVAYFAERGGPTPVDDGPPRQARRHEGTEAQALLAFANARETYARFCATCHGEEGRGDGPNASELPVPPTEHADSAYMATRSDDALYDAIAAGGYVMNRSNRMPAFGLTVTPATIRALVRHLRELCRCEGPSWSRDGGR